MPPGRVQSNNTSAVTPPKQTRTTRAKPAHNKPTARAHSSRPTPIVLRRRIRVGGIQLAVTARHKRKATTKAEHLVPKKKAATAHQKKRIRVADKNKTSSVQKNRIKKERRQTEILLKQLRSFKIWRNNIMRILRTNPHRIASSKSYANIRPQQQLRHVASIVYAHYALQNPVEVQVGRLPRGELVIATNRSGINKNLSADLGADPAATLELWANEALTRTQWGKASSHLQARIIRHATKYLQAPLDDIRVGVPRAGKDHTHAEVRLAKKYPQMTMVRGIKRPCGACATFYRRHHANVDINPHTGPVWLTKNALAPTGVDLADATSRNAFARHLLQTGDTYMTQLGNGATEHYDTDSDDD